MMKDKIKASFNLEYYQSYRHQSQYPVKFGYTRANLKYTWAQLRLSKHRPDIKLKAFKKILLKFRN
ncbi:MAG: hypothetical protein AMR96_02675 [Candidatus Adiutrix intracellularis]|nr:MAG: hypothetical protein AMR96_02675 [Candidatus Adiutrix intracellularis]